MTLFKHALKNIKKEWAVHLITMFQLAAVIVITLTMMSSLMLRYRYYKAFADVLNENSLYIGAAGTDLMIQPNDEYEYGKLVNEKVLREFFPSAEKIITCGWGLLELLDENGQLMNNTNHPELPVGYNLSAVLYDDELINRCKPELSEGRWLKTSEKADCLEGVISSNYFGIEVGDTVRLWVFVDPYAEQPFKGIENIIPDEQNPNLYYGEVEVKIVGKIRENAKVVGYQSGKNGPAKSVMSFYGTTSLNQLDSSVIVMSTDYIAKETDIDYGVTWPIIVKFPEGTPESVFKEAKKLVKDFGVSEPFKLDSYVAPTKDFIYEHVRQLLPIIIVLTVMLIVSSVSSSALSARRSLKSYAVYYITGLEWKHCGIISLIQAAIIAAASVIPAAAAAAVISCTELRETYRIIFTGGTALILFGILAFYILISMIMPLLMLSRTTPKQILTK